jgi:hypothetical protein
MSTTLILKMLYDVIPDLCQEKFGNTKGVIRFHKSKKDWQHNGQRKKDKQRSTQYCFILSFIGSSVILLLLFHWCWFVYLDYFVLFLKVVIRQVPLMEQELLTLLEHPRSSLFCWGFIAQSLVICAVLSRSVWRYQRSNQNPYIEEQTT